MEDIYALGNSKFGEPVAESSTEIKYECPECGHKSLALTIENGLYYCFVCYFGRGKQSLYGSDHKLVKAYVNDDIHLQVCQFCVDTFPLLSHTYQYLTEERGLLDPYSFGLRTVPLDADVKLKEAFTEEELQDSGFFRAHRTKGYTCWPCLKFNRILIPIYNEDTLIGVKTRRDPRLDAVDPYKYALPTGSSFNNVGYLPTDSKDLIITEGEIKGFSSYQYGYSTLFSSGINGAPYLIKFLRSNPRKFDRHFVLFDNDGLREDGTQKMEAITLANQIEKAIPNTVAVWLPKDKADQKAELDTFLKLNSLNEFDQLLEDTWYGKS
jgi:hypothetical protein